MLKSFLWLSLLFIGPAYAQDVPSAASASANSQSLSDLLKKGLEAYRSGRFDVAVENYETALRQDPKSAEAYAGLTRVYLKQQHISKAAESAIKGVATIESALTRTALGEVYFRQARMSEAEKEFITVVNTPHPEARAYLGLARLYDAYSLHARAKVMLDKAHALDHDDPEIQRRWIRTLKRSEQIEWLRKYLGGPTNDDAEGRRGLQDFLVFLTEREKQPHASCKLATKLASTEAELKPMLIDAKHMHGFGLAVKINGQSSRLLLDTGASGLFINSKLAKRAGIQPLSTTHIGGIGDQGSAAGYIGYADSIKVGELEFKNCLVEVSDKRSVLDDDGLIGADVFSHYLVSIDFAGEKLRLQELPKRPGAKEAPVTLGTEQEDEESPAEQSETSKSEASPSDSKNKEPVVDHGPYDRYIAPEMESYTKVFRFGHDLLIPTRVGDTPPKLFLIDTGAMFNSISPEAAREVTKVHEDPNMHVRGISGSVKKVYSADKAVLQFSHFKQENQDLTAMDLSQISRSDGTEVSGILGFVTLRFMVIKIDYRDGLVDFEYKPPPGLR